MDQPLSARISAWAMFAGGALTAFHLHLQFVDWYTGTPYTTERLLDMPFYAVAVGLWFLLSSRTRRGDPRARIPATVLFGIFCFLAALNVRVLIFDPDLADLHGGLRPVDMTIAFLVWLCGLVAVTMLWQPAVKELLSTESDR